GWDSERTATSTDTYVTDTYVDETAGTTDVDRGDYSETRTAAAGETINVPVHEEELTATRREVERGSVRVEKDVVEEEQTLDVPVTEERVTVQRRTVDRDATADDTAFEGGSIDVPVRGEEVDVQKRARVTEEVEIGKEAVERTERVSDTVRREEVRVDDETTGGVTDIGRSDRERGS
nr:YsnF/AvaK domain-containing protein [Chloroflexia bacterium]